MLINQSINQSINQLYSAGLFSTSVIHLSRSKILKTKTSGRAAVLPLVGASMFLRVPLPPPTAVRPPHRPENEARCVWKNAAVKQPSVRSLPFKTERFTATVTKTTAVPTARAR